MKQKLLLFLMLLFAFFKASPQQLSTLSGTLQDTAELKTLAYATVLVMKASDSTLAGYTWAGDDGRFVIKKLPAGKMRLLVTHPGYADYEDFVEVNPGEQKQLGTINMLSKTNLLKTVIIRDRLEAIRIKGDTTEFLVDSFLTNKNATVEDLMKKLPGIQVDKDGKITAQGKEVKKVLVDGEEFFGDDPTIATKNIKATQVESVQVFDKKSDQATISGIDDGVKEKTINLKLKDDAKKGYFGKVSAGLGTENRYEHEAMFNRFNRRQKVSGYAAMSNTNKTSLDWEDNRKFGGDGDENFFMDDDGNSYMYYTGNENDFDGVGIPQTWYAGAHYSDKKNNDKHAYAFNFSHKEMNVEGFDSNFTKYILPDTFYFNNQNNKIDNFRKGNNFSASYNVFPDSFTTIKIKVSANQGEYRKKSFYNSENRNEEQALVNSTVRTNTDDGTTEGLSSSINYVRKFRLKGRSLSLGVTQEYTGRESEGLLNSSLRFYTTDSTFTSQVIDQKKTNLTKSEQYSFNATYTEPLGSKFFIVTDYGLNSNRDKSTRLTLEKAINGEYTSQLDSLSNDFRYNVMINRGGVSFKYQFKKITASAGGRVSYTDLQQLNLVTDTTRSQSFLNYFPAARFNYKIGTSSSFEISYNGRTRQPTLQQIQPLIDNTNPLEIYIGNTGLVQSFSNTYRVQYNSYKPLTGRGIWTSLYYSHAYDDFASRDAVDGEGRRIHQTVNVDGNRMLYANVYHYMTTKKFDLHINNHMNTSVSRNVNFVNGLENVNQNRQISYGLGIGKDKEDKYDFHIGAEWSYNTSSTSIRPDVITSFWIQTYDANMEIYLPKKVIFEADATFNIRQKTSEFDNNLNTTIINAGLYRKFLKSEDLHIGVQVRDLLNQNLGFRRTANSNFINENVHSVLRRYVMLTVTYNFNNAGAGGKGDKE